MLPSQNPAAPNLVDVQLEAPGGRVRSLTVQGKDVPLKRPFTAVSSLLLAAQLDRVGMCV